MGVTVGSGGGGLDLTGTHHLGVSRLRTQSPVLLDTPSQADGTVGHPAPDLGVNLGLLVRSLI